MIFIKTEANEKVGGGHLGRSFSLAVEFVNRGYKVNIILSNTPTRIINAYKHKDISFQFISDNDKYNLNSYLSFIPAQSTIIFDNDDNKYYSGKLIRGLREFGIRTVCFTISDKGFIETDFLINPNIISLSQSYHTAPHTILLLGPEYMIFNKLYRGIKVEKTYKKHYGFSLMITFGNADVCDLTILFLKVLASKKFSFSKVYVIVGKLVSNLSEISKLSEKAKENNVEVLYNTEDLRAFYANVDAIITSGGMSMWEGIVFALPAIVFASSNRELEYVDYMMKQKFIYKFGDFRALPDTNCIAALLNEIPDKIKDKDKLQINQLIEKVDTNGIYNIIDRLIE